MDPLTFGSEQVCFGCGPHNALGMRLRFAREGDSVVTTYTPPSGFDGPPGVLHGGLQATICDEVAGWALVGLLGRMGFTTSMTVRYMRPVRVGVELTARARIVSVKGAIVTLRVKLSQDGKTGCTASVSYTLPTADAAAASLELDELHPTWVELLKGPEGLEQTS